MQHVIILYDPVSEQPFLTPYRARLWRDDQNIMWSFSAPNVWWDPEKAEPIVFSAGGGPVSPWPGSQPSPIGPPPEPPERDRRRYVADGGTPNPGTDPILYAYDAWLEWEVMGDQGVVEIRRGKVRARPSESEFAKVEPIDPEIVNEPEP